MTVTITPRTRLSICPTRRCRRAARPTPVTLRRLGVACVVTAILAGILLGVVSYQRASRLQDAADKTRQLVVLTDARSQVAAAEAAATGAFLGRRHRGRRRPRRLPRRPRRGHDRPQHRGGQRHRRHRRHRLDRRGRRHLPRHRRVRPGAQPPETSRSARPTCARPATAWPPTSSPRSTPRSPRCGAPSSTNAPPVTVALTVLAVLAFLVCFVWASRVLSRHTRRTLNIGVVSGGLLVVVVLVAFLVATRRDHLDRERRGRAARCATPPRSPRPAPTCSTPAAR